MSQNSQTHFKNLAAFCCKIFKVCLTILEHYALKGYIQTANEGSSRHIFKKRFSPDTYVCTNIFLTCINAYVIFNIQYKYILIKKIWLAKLATPGQRT